MHAAHTACEQCLAFDKQAFAGVAQDKKTISLTCPFGVKCTLAPICAHGELLGYIYNSHGVSDSPETTENLIRNARALTANELDAKALEKALLATNRYSDEELEQLRLLTDVYAHRLADIGLPHDRPVSVAEMIEQYLLLHFKEKISLRDISMQLHYSIVTLTQSFKNAFGRTIMQRLCEIRMSEAERLLRGGSLGIAAIAEQCGFGGIEYFSKCFKQSHGVPPGEWRKAQS
jgi:AraC-like DNA-binding protein